MTLTWSENWENGWEIRRLYLVQLVSLIGAFYCLAPMRVVHFKLMFQMAGNILTPSLPKPVKFPGWMMDESAWELYFPVLYHLFSVLSVLMRILSHANAKKKMKKAYGFQILHFYGSFSNDIMAVKGLRVRFEQVEEDYTWKICLTPFLKT